MISSIATTAISIAKNRRVQRVVIGALIGAAVGYAVAKTAAPYLFPEVEVEMIPPYDTPEDITLRENMSAHGLSWKHAGIETPISTVDKWHREDNMLIVEGHLAKSDVLPEEVLENLKWEPADGQKVASKGKLKYSKPVSTLSAEEHAFADSTIKTAVDNAATTINKNLGPTVSTFSTREANPLTGGGDAKEKRRNSREVVVDKE